MPTKHAYIRTENVSLNGGAMFGIETALANAAEASDKAHEILTITTSVDGKTTITEARFNTGLLTAWEVTQNARAGVNIEDFIEPLTETVIDPDTGEEVEVVLHHTRQSAAAADARRWLRENPAFQGLQ